MTYRTFRRWCHAAPLLCALSTGCAAAQETPAPEYPSPQVLDAHAGAVPAAEEMPAPGMPVQDMPAQAPMPVRAPDAIPAQPAAPPAQASSAAKEVASTKAADRDQMIVFTGTMSMEVDKGDVAAAIDKIVDLAVANGGHVFQQDNHAVTVRVPSAHFRKAMQQMEKVGDVTARSVQSQDVTEEYYDLGVRLKSLHATRDRLQDFLDRAKTIEEVLRVEQELARLNGQIDQIEGRMRFLATRASMSTITVTLTPKRQKPQQVVAEKPPPPPSPRTIPLPIEWLSSVGIDQLLNLESE